MLEKFEKVKKQMLYLSVCMFVMLLMTFVVCVEQKVYNSIIFVGVWYISVSMALFFTWRAVFNYLKLDIIKLRPKNKER